MKQLQGTAVYCTVDGLFVSPDARKPVIIEGFAHGSEGQSAMPPPPSSLEKSHSGKEKGEDRKARATTTTIKRQQTIIGQ